MILKKLFKFLKSSGFQPKVGSMSFSCTKRKQQVIEKKKLLQDLAFKKSLVCAVPETKLYNLAQNLNHMNKYVYLLQNGIEVINVNAKF